MENPSSSLIVMWYRRFTEPWDALTSICFIGISAECDDWQVADAAFTTSSVVLFGEYVVCMRVALRCSTPICLSAADKNDVFDL